VPEAAVALFRSPDSLYHASSCTPNPAPLSLLAPGGRRRRVSVVLSQRTSSSASTREQRKPDQGVQASLRATTPSSRRTSIPPSLQNHPGEHPVPSPSRIPGHAAVRSSSLKKSAWAVGSSIHGRMQRRPCRLAWRRGPPWLFEAAVSRACPWWQRAGLVPRGPNLAESARSPFLPFSERLFLLLYYH
jgi:hypothetical protein